MELTPKIVFDCFAAVNKVPRRSKHEEQMIAFLEDFGKRLGLKTLVDETGNVLIRKPATAGLEALVPPLLLQSHMDMVSRTQRRSVFDFRPLPH